LAQFRAGEAVRFTSITSAQAIGDVRTFFVQKTKYLEDIAVARGSLATRLMRENLIHGCVYD
jgi:allophanate hydrolase